MRKIALILSGCGHKDGTEITEAVSTIIALSQLGAKVSFFAPENSMAEAARITRGNIECLAKLNP